MHSSWATALRLALGLLLLRQGYCIFRGLDAVRPEALVGPDLARLVLPALGPVLLFGYFSVVLAVVGGVLMILGMSVRWVAGLNGFVVGLVPLVYGLEHNLLTRGRGAADAEWGPCANNWTYSVLILIASLAQIAAGSGAWVLTRAGWRR